MKERALKGFLGLVATSTVGWAIYVCLSAYLFAPSWENDEAVVVINLIRRDVGGLFSRLLFNQTFPRSYLSAIWWIQHWFGFEFLTIRFLPLVFGVSGLLLWAWIYIRLFARSIGLWFGVAAILLFAASNTFYMYATMVKPYGADLFLSGFCFWFGITRVRPALTGGLGRWAGICVIWLLPCFLSYTYAFCVAALAAVLLLRMIRRMGDDGLIRSGILVGLGLVFVAVLWAVELRHSQGDPGLKAFWADRFIGSGSRLTGTIDLLSETLSSWWRLALPGSWGGQTNFGIAVLSLIAFAWAAYRWKRKDRDADLPACGAALFFILIALSALEKYPMAERLWFFFMPFQIAAIIYLFASVPRRYGAVPAVLIMGAVFFRGAPEIWQLYHNAAQYWYTLTDSMPRMNPAVSKWVVTHSVWDRSLQELVETYPQTPDGMEFVTEAFDEGFRPGFGRIRQRSELGEREYDAIFNDTFYLMVLKLPDDLETFRRRRPLPGFTPVRLARNLILMQKGRSEIEPWRP